MRSPKPVAIGLGILAAIAAIPPAVRAQGMMGPGHGWGFPGQSQPAGAVSIDRAVDIVGQALARLGNPDLVPVEVMEFSNNFYVIVAEKSTGIGAFELLIERNGFVHPEPGPNMMWNTKYGHMAGWGGSGMMGGPGGPAPAPGVSGQQLTRERAGQLLQAWLNQAFPGAKAEEGMAFHGYFTFDFERSGKVLGMASVNAYTGQVWYHTWHGTFIQEKKLR